MSDIAWMISTHGVATSITSVSITTDTWGYTSESNTNYAMNMVVQMMDGESEEVKAGVLSIGDIMAFIDPDDTNISYITNDNFIIYRSNTYKIKNIIKEPSITSSTWSHWEIHANKII